MPTSDPDVDLNSSDGLLGAIASINRSDPELFKETEEWLERCRNEIIADERSDNTPPRQERAGDFLDHALSTLRELRSPDAFLRMGPTERERWALRLLRVIWIMTDTSPLDASELSWLSGWEWGEYELGEDADDIDYKDFANGRSLSRLYYRMTEFEPHRPEWEQAARTAFRMVADRAHPTHSDDFRSVNWYGVHYTFTRKQAQAVRVLWQHWERDVPVHEDSISKALDSVAALFRLDHLFRDSKKNMHPAWLVMIHKAGTRIYTLGKMKPQKNHQPIHKPDHRSTTRRRAESQANGKQSRPKSSGHRREA